MSNYRGDYDRGRGGSGGGYRDRGGEDYRGYGDRNGGGGGGAGYSGRREGEYHEGSRDRGGYRGGHSGGGGYNGRGSGEGGSGGVYHSQRQGEVNRNYGEREGEGYRGYSQREDRGYGSGRGRGAGSGYGGGGGGYDGNGRGGGGGEYRGRGGYSGAEHRGGRGGYGDRKVSTTVSTLSLGAEPDPLPFNPPKQGEQDGYKAAANPGPAIRQGKKTFEVFMNAWEFECDDRVVYSYDVSVGLEVMGNDETTRTISLNKKQKNEGTSTSTSSVDDRCVLIKEALKAGLEMYRIMSQTGYPVSDGGALLYSNESLDAAFKMNGHKLNVPMEELSEDVQKLIRHSKVKNIVIEICGSKRFNIKDFSGMMELDRNEMDQSVKQFFEIITSENAVSTHNYDSFSGGKLYRADPDGALMGGNRFARDVKFGQERRPGMFKGFTLANKKDSIIPALNIDITTGTFWREQKLFETIMELNKWTNPHHAVWDARAISKTNEKIKDLRVSYTKQDGAFPIVFKVHALTASTTTTTNGETKVDIRTMKDFEFKNSDGNDEPLLNKFAHANLQLSGWPLIEFRRRNKDNEYFSEYYPVELLEVMANQRVPLKKQGADPERAMQVSDRWKTTQRDLEALNLFGDKRPTNSAMEAYGIRISRKPLSTTAYTRRMPTVTFNREANVEPNSVFKTGQLSYHTPAHITTLFIAASEDSNRFDHNGFARALMQMAAQKRMRIDQPIIETVNPNDLYTRLKRIADDRKAGNPKMRNVVFMYIEPEAKDHHDELKLFERKWCVVTQHVTMENAQKMIMKRPMLENLLLKLNVKGGGHNYNVKPEKFALDLWMGKQTLIMGYDVCHPTGQNRQDVMADRLADPSVVGFSFNGGSNPDSFIGDYHFQQSRRERVDNDVLNARLKWMLGIFEKNRGVLPPLIIVVRDGISDGQYKHGMDELSELREAATEYAVSKARLDMTGKPPVPGYLPKFIFAVATKRHHKRFYAGDSKAPSNLPAMSVIDDTITNPVLFEFYMQSHTPIQGTGSSTKYTVLKDDVGTTMDSFQSLMGALCFEHQVSTSAISIPEPVYQSDEWAKRGSKNMRMFKQIFGEHGQFKKDFTYEKLTTTLAYWTSSLAHVRVNA